MRRYGQAYGILWGSYGTVHEGVGEGGEDTSYTEGHEAGYGDGCTEGGQDGITDAQQGSSMKKNNTNTNTNCSLHSAMEPKSYSWYTLHTASTPVSKKSELAKEMCL